MLHTHTQLFSMISFWIYLPERYLFRSEPYEKFGIQLFDIQPSKST
jgi:hypothetical protein